MENGIFISYRRGTGSLMARMIYDRLCIERHYRCFLDVDSLSIGNFKRNIEDEIKKCDIFILILSKDALNRCVNPNDAVRKEILYAKQYRLNFIPVMSEDFEWPEKMPEGIEDVQDMNAITYLQIYSSEFFAKLYGFIDRARGIESKKDSSFDVKGTREDSQNGSEVSKKVEHKNGAFLRGNWKIIAAVPVFAILMTAVFGMQIRSKNIPLKTEVKDTAADDITEISESEEEEIVLINIDDIAPSDGFRSDRNYAKAVSERNETGKVIKKTILCF